MELKAGDRLGHFQIVGPAGAGGMGEVYRAHDPKLGREVAIKILPTAFAMDRERMDRFDQEARAIAALNHPNVVSIFDAGTHDGVRYIVSELLEGETLRQRLDKGAIPASKAVEYARQIVDGLAAAHERAIVHRDLKPENLFLTSGGRVKILDFGLAKRHPLPTAIHGSSGDTSTMPLPTTPGVILGTMGYMAPEQVRGESVDHRADIFSFGATLYEMVTGNRAFTGPTSVETMHAILNSDPPHLSSQALHVIPGLQRIVSHCLEKEVSQRFQSTRDLMFALSLLPDTSRAAESRATAAPPRLSIAAILVGVTALLTALLLFAFRRANPSERVEFAVVVPGEVSTVAISSDGKWLAFVSWNEASGAPMLYVQRIGSAAARSIAGTENASYPFWSPDDGYIAFFASGQLKKVPVAGGEPQSLARVGSRARGGSWSTKGVIIYAPDTGGPLWRVDPDGTGEAPLTEKLLLPTEASHRWPFFLPDGDRFLMFAGKFTKDKDDQSTGIYISSLSKGNKIRVTSARSSPAYGGGSIYYVDDNGALVSAPLDPNTGSMKASPRVLAGSVARSPSTYYALFAVSGNSTVVYSSESTTNRSQLTWFDRTGKELGTVGSIGVLANPALSPDATRIALDSTDVKAGNVDVWILDMRYGSSSRFTFEAAEESTPVWSRDGSRIAYRVIAPVAIHVKKLLGLEANKPLAAVGTTTEGLLPNSWSSNDTEILCTFAPAKGGTDLVVLPADGNKPRPFLNGLADETSGQISPDGKWVAYASNETGDWEIYVTTFPAGEGKWQVSHFGGTEPRWRGDGKVIFYIGPKQMLTEVAVDTGATFSTIATRALFRIQPRVPISSTDLFSYDVTRDGERFLVNQYVKPEPVSPLRIVLHATGVDLDSLQ